MSRTYKKKKASKPSNKKVIKRILQDREAREVVSNDSALLDH